MKIINCASHSEMSKTAADMVREQVVSKPNSVLGLATGSTPIEMYKLMSEMNLDFSGVVAFNLDEYYPIKKSNDQSYDYFMKDKLFNRINIKAHYIPNGEADDPQAECKRYDELIKEHGGIDLQILGIGPNGHIGFNEPAENLSVGTHMIDLTPSTIEANARFFASADDVPRKALTMGMGTIFTAKKIVLMLSGAVKKPAYDKMTSGFISTNCPASILNLHNDVTVITGGF